MEKILNHKPPKKKILKASPPHLSVASGEWESTFLPARSGSSNQVFVGPKAAHFWNRSPPGQGTSLGIENGKRFARDMC